MWFGLYMPPLKQSLIFSLICNLIPEEQRLQQERIRHTLPLVAPIPTTRLHVFIHFTCSLMNLFDHVTHAWHFIENNAFLLARAKVRPFSYLRKNCSAEAENPAWNKGCILVDTHIHSHNHSFKRPFSSEWAGSGQGWGLSNQIPSC